MPLIVTRGLGAPGFVLSGAVLSAGGVLTMSFTSGGAVTLVGTAAVAANWVVSGPTQVTPVSVSASGSVVTLRTTHPYQPGGSYSVAVPTGVTDANNDPFLGPVLLNVLGAGDGCSIVSASSVDARTLRVVFDSAPGASALVAANYAPVGFTISAIQKETDSVFLLTTSHQLIGSGYSITSPGVTTG